MGWQVSGTEGGGALRDVGDDVWRRVMVSTMITLSRDLGIAVTAEGVESAEQLKILEGLGCDCVQGFLIGAPMSAAEAGDFIAQWLAEGAGERHGFDVAGRLLHAA